MDCEEIREHLSAYVDDLLDAGGKARVEEHLLSCKACQQELASLKALVSELGSLESVEPPKDFLDQLNERIEARSWVPKILRTLFKPMRVKIPLEFAGAVAVAILVLVFLHTQKEELGLKQAPVGLVKQEGPSEQVAMEKQQAKAPWSLEGKASKGRVVDSSRELAKDEAYERQLARKGGEERRKVIELTLVMNKEIPPESLEPGAAMEAAPTPPKKMRRSLALQETAPPARPKTDEELDDSLSRLKKLIELLGGEVVSVEYDEQTKRLASIGAQIPAHQIHTFYNKLKELGDLRTPPEAVTGKGNEVLSVSIRLLPSE
jgi:hypothetical protein